jgi:hypothetical protein
MLAPGTTESLAERDGTPSRAQTVMIVSWEDTDEIDFSAGMVLTPFSRGTGQRI